MLHDDAHADRRPADAEAEGRATWRRATGRADGESPANHAPVAPGTADPLALAAWIDGRASAADAARLESAIAADPALAAHVGEAIATLRDADAAPPTSLPMVRRAVELVPAAGPAAAGAARPPVLRWAMTAAACLVAGVVGYRSGALSTARPADPTVTTTSIARLDDLTLGAIDGSSGAGASLYDRLELVLAGGAGETVQ